MEGRGTQGPGGCGSGAHAALRRRPPAGVRLPAGPLRPAGAGRGPHRGDVPGRGDRLPAHSPARPEHRLAGRDRPAQAGRPLAGRRARTARPAGGRLGAGPTRRSVGRAAGRAARPPDPGRAHRHPPGRADPALPGRPARPAGGAGARAHGHRDRGAAGPGQGRVPPQLPRTRGRRVSMSEPTDPLHALRAPIDPVDPDPGFAAALRARVERALLAPEGEPAMTVTTGQTTARTTTTPQAAAALRLHALTPYLAVVDAERAVEFY